MPTPGLSLVGFLSQQQALEHFEQACLPSSRPQAALTAEWTDAQARLGAAIPNAGQPNVQPLPESAKAHVESVRQAAWAVPFFEDPNFSPASFACVEIDPLLAYQLTVSTAHSDGHWSSLQVPPTMGDMLSICLPSEIPQTQFSTQLQRTSLVIKAHSLNLRILQLGLFNNQFAGIVVGTSLPLVQVVRHNGAYILWNGYHRACGLRAKGATHIPCVLRDVVNPGAVAEVLVPPMDGLLASTNAPTVGHFTQGRAHPVTLKVTSRMLHLSWAEWAITED